MVSGDLADCDRVYDRYKVPRATRFTTQLGFRELALRFVRDAADHGERDTAL